MSNLTDEYEYSGIEVLHQQMPFLLTYLTCYSITTVAGIIGKFCLNHFDLNI